MEANAGAAPSLEREWWLRTLRVVRAPGEVFASLRDEGAEDANARQEPVLAVTLLAGVAGVLATNTAGRLLDDFEYDGLLVAVWAAIGGIIYGAAAYFLAGGLLLFGMRAAGSPSSYRRARHLLALAAVPVAASLAVWPVRLAVFGGDSFRTGGSDAGGVGTTFRVVEMLFVAWSLALLLFGLRIAERWTWGRSAAAVVVAAAPLALLVALVETRDYWTLGE